MQVSDEQQPVNLNNVLQDMGGYLHRWAQGCAEMSDSFYRDKVSSMEKLTQIMEGLSYCPQLFQSAAILTKIDSDAEKNAITVFNEDLERIYSEIEQAATNEDYSLIVDLVESDLLPVIQTAQKLLDTIQQRNAGGIV